MLSLVFAIIAGLVSGTVLGFIIPYIGAAITLGAIVTIVVFIFLAKHFSKQLQMLFASANVEIQKQNFDIAIEIIKSGYRLKNWQFLVGAQISSQIGMILYSQKKFGEAYKYLQKSNPRLFLPYCMLAIGHLKHCPNCCSLYI